LKFSTIQPGVKHHEKPDRFTPPLHRLKNSLIIFTIVLSGCGGGGGANQTTQNKKQITDQNVNIPTLIGSVLEEETYGTSSERLLDYLREFANCGDCPNWSGTAEIHTFYEINNANDIVRINPVLRIASNANNEQKAIVHHAASLINNVLPYDRHIKIGEEVGSLSVWDDIGNGQIYVDFAPYENWIDIQDTENTLGYAQYRRATDDEGNRIGIKARIWMLDNPREHGHPNELQLFTMVHEILHTLGLTGHVLHEDYPESSLGVVQENGELFGVPNARRNITQLGKIDADSLTAIRRLYENSGEELIEERRLLQTADITLENLGEWDTSANRLFHNISGIEYGVLHYQDVAIPYARPSTSSLSLQPSVTHITENTSISGSATWNGNLLGLDGKFESVQGNVEIGVNLNTLNGNATFTDIVYRNNRRKSWGDNLNYDIAIGGNFLYSDDGSVNGRFYGTSHEGVAGTLGRSDLAAAFGATR